MNSMGFVYADITLINTSDEALEKGKVIDIDEIRRITVSMLVDSGAYMMGITETVQAYLQLPFVERKTVVLGDGSRKAMDVVGPVKVKFSNRTAICSAFVLEGSDECLLGAIPMEEMDVVINPKRQELTVNPAHPDYAVLRM